MSVLINAFSQLYCFSYLFLQNREHVSIRFCISYFSYILLLWYCLFLTKQQVCFEVPFASSLPGECNKLTLVNEWLQGDCKEVVDSTNDEPSEAEQAPLSESKYVGFFEAA